jgi:hypothetical protein
LIVYNVTIQVEWEIAEAWLEWEREVQVPGILGTGMFERCRIHRLMDLDDRDGPTYAFQFYGVTDENYRRFQREFAMGFQEMAFAKWGQRLVAHRTVMELLHG